MTNSEGDIFRKVTGICEKCEAPMKGHPQCSGCSILVGEGHVETGLKLFRGKRLCSFCVVEWPRRESKVFGRTLTFAEFQSAMTPPRM